MFIQFGDFSNSEQWRTIEILSISIFENAAIARKDIRLAGTTFQLMVRTIIGDSEFGNLIAREIDAN